MRITIESVPAVAARCLDDVTGVYVGGHTQTRWDCPIHGKYIQQPWVVVRAFQKQAMSLGCPRCARKSSGKKNRAHWSSKRNGGKGAPATRWD